MTIQRVGDKEKCCRRRAVMECRLSSGEGCQNGGKGGLRPASGQRLDR